MISISVSDQTPLATVYDFKQQLEADPRVAGVTFVTKDEELQRFSADPRNRDLIANIEGNPVPAKLEVHVKNLSDVDAINNLGRTWRGADRTDPTDYQGDFIARMVKLSAWLSLAGYALMAILVVVSVVIVMNTIRTAVYHRRQEIEVMKLVGATEWFVRGPFLIEGVMTGVIARPRLSIATQEGAMLEMAMRSTDFAVFPRSAMARAMARRRSSASTSARTPS